MAIMEKHLAKEAAPAPNPYVIDPRTDLKEDHPLWNRLLSLASGVDIELAQVLHGLRCGGTRLRKLKGFFVLRPDVDPAGRVAWEKQEDYEELRDKYLKPRMDEVVDLLKRLTREVGQHEKHPA